jgi:hypothetical protein
MTVGLNGINSSALFGIPNRMSFDRRKRAFELFWAIFRDGEAPRRLGSQCGTRTLPARFSTQIAGHQAVLP